MIREYQPRLFMMINFRPIAEDTCNEEWTGNMTRLVPGSYEWRDVGERGIIIYVIINFMCLCSSVVVEDREREHGIKVKADLIILNIKTPWQRYLGNNSFYYIPI